MPEIGWRTISEPNPDTEYVVLASYLPLRSLRKMVTFFRYSQAIRKQLKESNGLVGYSMRAHLLSRKFWTLSVWEDRKALYLFVREMPHSRIIETLRPHLNPPRFVEWNTKGSMVPPSWDEALERLR